MSRLEMMRESGVFDLPMGQSMGSPSPSTRFAGDIDPAGEDYYSFSFADTVLGLPRGLLSGASDIVNLFGLPFGTELVEDRFGLMEASRTIGGDLTSGVSNFLTGLIPGVGIASKLGTLGTLGKISAKIDSSIAAAVNGANAARKAGDFAKAASLGRKASALGVSQEITKYTAGGAIGDFFVWDGHEARLSELIMTHTELEIPVLDWLATTDDETALGEVTGRLKNAIEGAGLGLVADGLFGALRIMRAGKKAVDNGVAPTKAMVIEARKIREAQEIELQSSFNLTREEANVANILIDRIGIDRSRLRIVSGEDAINIYAEGSSEVLNSIPVRRGRKPFDVDAGIRSILKSKRLSNEAIENHPLILDMPEAMRPHIKSMQTAVHAVDAWENVFSRIEDLIVPLTEAGASMHGGYKEMVDVMTHYLGPARMQAFAMFSAATSPQTVVPTHTEIGIRLATETSETTLALFDELKSAMTGSGQINKAKAEKILKNRLYSISQSELKGVIAGFDGQKWVGKTTSEKSGAEMASRIRLLAEEAGDTGIPASSHASNAMRAHNLILSRFYEATLDAIEGGFDLTAEDIFRTLDFSDVPGWFGGASANKMRGFMGSSMGLRADSVLDDQGTLLLMQGPNQALDTWMSRIIPDDAVTPQMRTKKREVVKRDSAGNVVRDAEGKSVKVTESYEAMETLLDAKKRFLTQTGNYAAYASLINKMGKVMGLLPDEIQERIWGSIVSIIALKSENIPLDRILKEFSAEDIRKTWDLSEVFSNERVLNAVKPFIKDEQDLFANLQSVLSEIRARVRTPTQGDAARPSSLVSDPAAFEKAVEAVGVSRSATGAQQVIVKSRRARGLTKETGEYSRNWRAEFDAYEADFFKGRNLPEPGSLRSDVEQDYLFDGRVVLARVGKRGKIYPTKAGKSSPEKLDVAVRNANPSLLEESVGGRAVGFAKFVNDGMAIIGGLKDADFGTAVHELGHVARRFILDETVPESARLGITKADIDKMALKMGATRDPSTNKWVWSVAAEERFTNALIKYMRTGEVPAGGYKSMFLKVKMWLRNVWNDLDAAESLPDIDKETADILGKLLNRGPEVEITGVTAGRIGGATLLKSAPYNPDREFPPKPSMGPNPASLGTPAGSGGVADPYGAVNWNRFASNEDVSAYVKEFIEEDSNIDEFVPMDHKQVVDQAADDYRTIGDIVGNRSSANIREALDAVADTASLRQIGFRLQAMRRIVADVSARVHEIALKGDLASGQEIYEFIRGRRITEQMLYDIRSQQRVVGQMLGEQRITFDGNPRRANLAPPLPRIADPSQVRTRSVREVQSEGPTPVRPDERQGTLWNEAEAEAPEARPQAEAEAPEARPQAEAEAPEARPQAEAEVPDIGGLSPEQAQNVIRLAISENGGRDKIIADMGRVVAANAIGGSDNVAKYMRGTAKWGQALVEYWMNSILSGPVTHAVNITANAFTTIWVPMERGAGFLVRGQLREAYIHSIGRYLAIMNNFTDSLKLAKMAFAQDDAVLEAGTRAGLAEGLQSEGRAISGQALGINGLPGEAVSWIGKFLNLPTRFLAAEDEFFKQLNYRSRVQTELQVTAGDMFGSDTESAGRWVAEKFDKMLLDGQAYTEKELLRRAHKKASDAGITDPIKRSLYVERWMRDPDNWDPSLGLIAQRAVNDARYGTFTTPLSADGPVPTAIAYQIQKIAEALPLTRFLFPFIRTPTNLLNFALERVPGANLLYSRKLWQDTTKNLADPALKADITGRIMFGVGITATAIGAASSGVITGGGPKEADRRELWESTGWRPYSIRIGDTYYSYRRFDPFSSIIGIVADAVELLADLNAYGTEEEKAFVDSTLNTIVYATARNITNKTYLTGITNFSNALSDPKRYGQNLVNNFAGSLVPFSSAMGQSVGLNDDEPLYREVQSALDAMKSRIPGLAQQLPPRRDLFGKPIDKNRRGLMSAGGVLPENSPVTMFSPFEYSEVTSDRVANELRQLNHPFDRPSPQRSGGIDLRQFTTDDGQQAYDRWLQLHGEVILGGVTLRKAIESTMQSGAYQRLSPVSTDLYKSPRVRILRRIISRYRERAFDQMLRESSALREVYEVDRQRRAALLSGQRADELMNLAR